MKVKVKAQIELCDLFDSAHSQKEIHAMLEQLLNYASDESLIEEVRKRNLQVHIEKKPVALVYKTDTSKYIKHYRRGLLGEWVESKWFNDYKEALESVCENGISAGEFQIEEL